MPEMSDTATVQTVLTLVEGLAYAPWVKTVLLFGAAPVVLARCWCEVARYAMHSDSKALAGVLLMSCTYGARRLAAAETGLPLAPSPMTCPWPGEQIRGGHFWLEGTRPGSALPDAGGDGGD
jgi:hypothetical protein